MQIYCRHQYSTFLKLHLNILLLTNKIPKKKIPSNQKSKKTNLSRGRKHSGRDILRSASPERAEFSWSVPPFRWACWPSAGPDSEPLEDRRVDAVGPVWCSPTFQSWWRVAWSASPTRVWPHIGDPGRLPLGPGSCWRAWPAFPSAFRTESRRCLDRVAWKRSSISPLPPRRRKQRTAAEEDFWSSFCGDN